jgi:hypothetical protein
VDNFEFSPACFWRDIHAPHPITSPENRGDAEAYPGGKYEPANVLDGNLATEYSSDSKGTNTFLVFDFGKPTSIIGISHVDRNDPATVSESELTFLDAEGKTISNSPMHHVNVRSGESFLILSNPVTVQRVKWQVTGLGESGLGTVGAAEMAFYTLGQTDAAPTEINFETRSLQLLEQKNGKLVQWLRVQLDYPYAQSLDATLEAEGAEPKPVHLAPGHQALKVPVPAVNSQSSLTLKLQSGAETLASRAVSLTPVRKWQIFLLPHSHVDIGYTALQADVEKKQNANIETGLRLAQATGDYPEGARFKWNVEVLWPVENYLRDATPEKRAEFIAAVRSGQIGLDAFYGNILTGLCRPEELLNLMGYATRLSKLCGVPIESAMISDVPGYTWSTVSAMGQAGVKYFSFAPNYFDRMGGTMKEWQNRPFWWEGPDGKTKVLSWCPSRGYALGHLIGDGEAVARFLPEYLTELETNAYPYDITYLRWNVHGDNGSPDEKLADVVRDWNAKYIYPHLVISTTAEAFREFEKHYGDRLPQFSGDYTPYWEDGAASSAVETALNRASGERLVQAETLWAMFSPGSFPAESFQEVWRNILLYSEHTWGAHNSISQPDLPFVREQWKVKQGFALDADRESRRLLEMVLGSARRQESNQPNNSNSVDESDIEVLNTSSWSRTDLVIVSAELSRAGDQVDDEKGRPLLSQRLCTGELAFVARGVPAFASRRYRISSGAGPSTEGARVALPRLLSSQFFLRIGEETGAITNLFSRTLARELVAANAGTELNDYFYLSGSDLKNLQRPGRPVIHAKEKGPLVASLLIESSAPGCKSLTREVRLIEGLDQVEIINTIDKVGVRAKEGLHFSYAFAVAKGVIRMDVGWAEIRPEVDQIPAACKNWFSVQRWLDISNERFGVTWCPVDAPLVEVGGITANLVGSQTDPSAWIQHVQPSQTIYSWVMNNHWHTNYRADQEGPAVFRYALRPHRHFAPEEAAQFGASCSQPLLVRRAVSPEQLQPRLRLSSDKVIVSAFKPCDEGNGWIVRLFGVSGKAEKVQLSWSEPKPREIWLSDLSEEKTVKVGHSIEVPAWGIVTLKAE